MMLRSTCLLLSSALVLVACAPGAPPEVEDVRPKGLVATPEQLAFTCVTPGCDSSQKLMVEVVGDRRVAVKRVLLEGASVEDFSFTSSEAAPFVVGANSSFEIDVRYVPIGAPSAGAVNLLVTYTDASPDESVGSTAARRVGDSAGASARRRAGHQGDAGDVVVRRGRARDGEDADAPCPQRGFRKCRRRARLGRTRASRPARDASHRADGSTRRWAGAPSDVRALVRGLSCGQSSWSPRRLRTSCRGWSTCRGPA